jgi:hypothetical protein
LLPDETVALCEKSRFGVLMTSFLFIGVLAFVSPILLTNMLLLVYMVWYVRDVLSQYALENIGKIGRHPSRNCSIQGGMMQGAGNTALLYGDCMWRFLQKFSKT